MHRLSGLAICNPGQKFGEPAKDCSLEEVRNAAAARASRAGGTQRKGKRKANQRWEVDSVVGAQTIGGVRKYLISWKGEDKDGTPWEESFEPYETLRTHDVDGELVIDPEIDGLVAFYDALTPSELLRLSEIGAEQHIASTCALSVGDAVLYDAACRSELSSW